MDFHAGGTFVAPECQETSACSKGFGVLLIAIEQQCRIHAAGTCFCTFLHLQKYANREFHFEYPFKV